MKMNGGDNRMWRAWVERYSDPPNLRSGPESWRTDGDAKIRTPEAYHSDTRSRTAKWVHSLSSRELDSWIGWAWRSGSVAMAIALERERERRWQWVLRQFGQGGGGH